ncbi:hypothetical protein V6N12_055088, partial [Hibiscus sabdariffa]
MAANSFFNHLQDLDFTNEEKDVVFTQTIQWGSLNEYSDLLVIAKMISSKPIDDNTVVRAFQGIWKKENVISITIVKPNYFRIKFHTEEIRNDILSRGPWTFKDEWLALAAFNPNYNIDEYTFFSMNIWDRIYVIPSILMDNDDTALHTGNSLRAIIGKVIKVDTRRIDLNMVDYLRVGIILDVSKPVRRCVAIGGTAPSPKLCPLQYERLPTICYGCGHIGHIVESCPTFKQTPTSKLQYGDWIRYIPPRRQELNTHSKGSIRYLDGNRKQISNGKQLNAAQRVDDGKPPNNVDPTPTRASMQDAVSSPHPPIMVSIMNDATYTHPPSIAPKLAAATSHHPPSIATKLADATSKLPPTAVPKTAATNLSHPSNVAIVGQ